MEVLKFTLSGRSAFFKKPEVNSYCYFTYGNIHKVALLGLFGAILGYNGYIQMKEGDTYPEFYQKLKDLEVSIVPDEASKGSFPKKLQQFNNSVGYASTEAGGNLIVKQQWLENPRWDIYVKLDHEESCKLKDFLMNRKSVFSPYMGSNDHPADITNVQVCQAEPLTGMEGERIHSLFSERLVCPDYDEAPGKSYLYQEYLPTGLKETVLFYQSEKFFFTNIPIESYTCEIYKVSEKHIVFF